MLFKLIALTAPLCLDSLLIAAAIGLSRPSRRHKLRLSGIFALFEGGMPLVGLGLGKALSGSLGHATGYIAAVILIGFGLYMTLHARDEDTSASRLSEAHGLTMIALGLGISLDGLAIGFTFGVLNVPVVPAVLVIAGQAFLLSQAGFALGGRISGRWRQVGEKLANLALVAIGLVLLVQELIR